MARVDAWAVIQRLSTRTVAKSRARPLRGAHSRRRAGETDRVPSWTVDRTIVFKRLEQGGAVLRRAGLGRFVAAARRVAERRMGRFEMVVDGLSLTGIVGLHLQYVEELVAGAREDYLMTLFRSAAVPGATVLDVGAHLGYMTLQAARAVG